VAVPLTAVSNDLVNSHLQAFHLRPAPTKAGNSSHTRSPVGSVRGISFSVLAGI